MIEKTLLISLTLTLSLIGTSLAASANINTNSPSSGIESSRLSTSSHGLLQDFPSRKVVILRPSRSKESALNSYLVSRLADTFRYPYYQVSYQGIPKSISPEEFLQVEQPKSTEYRLTGVSVL